MLFYGVDGYHLITLRIIILSGILVNRFSENILIKYKLFLKPICTDMSVGRLYPLTVLNR